MTSLELNVPDDLEVERLAKEAGFETAGAYVEALVRADRRRRAEEWMSAEIRRGLDSPMSEMNEEAKVRILEEYDRRMSVIRSGGGSE